MGKNIRPGACNGASRPIDKAKHRGEGTCRACVCVCVREEVMPRSLSYAAGTFSATAMASARFSGE
jgi:hypothetical protein